MLSGLDSSHTLAMRLKDHEMVYLRRANDCSEAALPLVARKHIAARLIANYLLGEPYLDHDDDVRIIGDLAHLYNDVLRRAKDSDGLSDTTDLSSYLTHCLLKVGSRPDIHPVAEGFHVEAQDIAAAHDCRKCASVASNICGQPGSSILSERANLCDQSLCTTVLQDLLSFSCNIITDAVMPVLETYLNGGNHGSVPTVSVKMAVSEALMSTHDKQILSATTSVRDNDEEKAVRINLKLPRNLSQLECFSILHVLVHEVGVHAIERSLLPTKRTTLGLEDYAFSEGFVDRAVWSIMMDALRAKRTFPSQVISNRNVHHYVLAANTFSCGRIMTNTDYDPFYPERRSANDAIERAQRHNGNVVFDEFSDVLVELASLDPRQVAQMVLLVNCLPLLPLDRAAVYRVIRRMIAAITPILRGRGGASLARSEFSGMIKSAKRFGRSGDPADIVREFVKLTRP